MQAQPFQHAGLRRGSTLVGRPGGLVFASAVGTSVTVPRRNVGYACDGIRHVNYVALTKGIYQQTISFTTITYPCQYAALQTGQRANQLMQLRNSWFDMSLCKLSFFTRPQVPRVLLGEAMAPAGFQAGLSNSAAACCTTLLCRMRCKSLEVFSPAPQGTRTMSVDDLWCSGWQAAYDAVTIHRVFTLLDSITRSILWKRVAFETLVVTTTSYNSFATPSCSVLSLYTRHNPQAQRQ